MSENETKPGGTAGEMPWTDREMPCVYCGQAVPREVERCPHCKASYSLAVRRASREVEGEWFYLEPRNLSNRGVDFATMLKLIDKGRLKRDSVVRGPTTHQDWMFAAETPRLSKYLGVCPHCFSPAGPEQEFCENCDRFLDERPGRLRPGLKQGRKPGYFPGRDEIEEKLAEALATHDLATAAKDAATAQREETSRSAAEPAVRERPEVPSPAGQRPRGGEGTDEANRPKVKFHILALLTLATVVPLGLLMLWLPLDWVLPGSVDREGTTAWNAHHNQVAVRTAILGVFGVKAKAQTEEPQIAELLRDGDAAAENGELEKARSLFEKVRDEYRGKPAAKEAERKLAAVKEMLANRDQHRQDVMDRMQRIKEAINTGRSEEARRLMEGVSADDRALARKMKVDVALLEEQIGALEVKKRDEAQRERLREEVRGLLEKAQRAMERNRYKTALDIYEGIANKYPTEYMPAGVKLSDLVAEAKARLAGPAETVKSAAAPVDTATAARQLWVEVLTLESNKKFGDALKKCDELMALPEKDRPAGLAQKIKDLKRGELFGEE